MTEQKGEGLQEMYYRLTHVSQVRAQIALENDLNETHTVEWIERVLDEHDDLLAACKAQEEAEEHHSNCEECDDGSLCDTGTDLYRKAKHLRQAAIARAEGRA